MTTDWCMGQGQDDIGRSGVLSSGSGGCKEGKQAGFGAIQGNWESATDLGFWLALQSSTVRMHLVRIVDSKQKSQHTLKKYIVLTQS